MPDQMKPAYYALSLHAGPGRATVEASVELFTALDEHVARYEQGWFAFGYTWRDLAQWLESMWVYAGGELPPLSSPTPHPDLT